jgi:hypothetical protein
MPSAGAIAGHQPARFRDHHLPAVMFDLETLQFLDTIKSPRIVMCYTLRQSQPISWRLLHAFYGFVTPHASIEDAATTPRLAFLSVLMNSRSVAYATRAVKHPRIKSSLRVETPIMSPPHLPFGVPLSMRLHSPLYVQVS